MCWRFILNIIGILTIFLGLTMIFPLIVGLSYQDQSAIPILKSMAITILVGFFIFFIFRKEKAEVISQREGMAIVAVTM